jgi:hypothetical protein
MSFTLKSCSRVARQWEYTTMANHEKAEELYHVSHTILCSSGKGMGT